MLYCARHTFGTAAYAATGNLAMVMNVMGHTDVRTAMRYQHPVLDSVRQAGSEKSTSQTTSQRAEGTVKTVSD